MNDIIDDLVADLTPAEPARPNATMIAGLGVAALISILGVVMVLGPRPDLMLAIQTANFWIKFMVMALLAACAWPVLLRLARPGSSPGLGLAIAAFVAGGLIVAGGVNLLLAPASERMYVLLGHSWSSCLWKVALTSIPLFAGTIIALRRMAPTRLRQAGFAAGLVAGGVGAAIYSISCTEQSLTFVASWYLLAVALVAAAGALLGPRLLRW